MMSNEMMRRNAYLDGVMGVIMGDCVGMPVQFLTREEVREAPVLGMEGHGTYDKPAGTFSDDSSMALAAVDAMICDHSVNAKHIAENFVKWLVNGAYTQEGQAFDVGTTCYTAVRNYMYSGNTATCGCTDEHSNGNGSLMRIMPLCIYGAYNKDNKTTDEVIAMLDEVSGLTHNHLRSRMACRLYYFLTRSIMEGRESKTLNDCIKAGVKAFYDYQNQPGKENELRQLSFFDRMKNTDEFMKLNDDAIRSSGYVIDTIEAAVWSLLTTGSFENCILKAVNLGYDTDSVGAVAGGLAGLYYGYENMPQDWVNALDHEGWPYGRRELEDMLADLMNTCGPVPAK